MSIDTINDFDTINEPNDLESALTPSVWPTGTKLTLLNVKWNSDYRDLVRFSSQAALDAWIDDRPNMVIANVTYQSFNSSVIINTPINRAMKYNYIRTQNKQVPGDDARTYYYFITDAQKLATNSTLLTLQLDVWQTFGYEVTFGNSFIERGHYGIANERMFEQYGRSYLTVPEGLDMGGEYRIVHTEAENFKRDDDLNDLLNVLICSTVDLTADPGDASDPNLNTAKGSSFNGLPTGASFYVFETSQEFQAFMAAYSTKPWMTQGIISVSLVPIKHFYPDFIFDQNISPISGVKFYYGPPSAPQKKSNSMLSGWRDKNFIENILGARYGMLKKFLTYPYMILELTTFTSSPIIIKPESWQDADATITEMAAFMPPGQRIVLLPKRYNADAETLGASQSPNPLSADDNGDFLDMATVIDNFPSLPLVNNMALSFLASNKNGLAFQFRSADWSQQRAMAGAQAAFDVSGYGIQNTAAQAGIANRGAEAQAQLQVSQGITRSIVGSAGQIAGGLISGNAGGAVAGGASLVTGGIENAINAQGILESSLIGQGQRGESALADIRTTAQSRDTNNQYSQYAARGDYANAIAGVNAKIQDAQMTQPSTSGQFGGDAFNIINNIFGYTLRWKMPDLAGLRRIGDYWLRYGYAIQQFGVIPTNFMCMTRFTYWKLSETYISQGAFPEKYKQTLRGIFEKGVTVWADPDYIGDRARMDENEPIAGISY